jgi:predicted O-methyltransferase YrrM
VVDELMSEQVREYLDGLVPERPDELQKMETYARQHSFPIIGPACGNICYQLARLAGVRQVCELGSGYGYSTAWFARAVKENGGGAVQHIVWDDDLSQAAKQHLEKLGYSDTVQYHVGEAVAVLRGMDGPFDIIFNDIDKEGYVEFCAVYVHTRPRGNFKHSDPLGWARRFCVAGPLRTWSHQLGRRLDWITETDADDSTDRFLC